MMKNDESLKSNKQLGKEDCRIFMSADKIKG
jgi:hypothetical protein